MKWPRFGYMVFFTCLAWLCLVSVANAQVYGLVTSQMEQAKAEEKQTTGAMHKEATTDGACDFDDSAKKKFAQQAQKSMTEAVQELVEYNKLIMKHFEAENGSCHYLNTQWGNDARPQNLRFNDYAVAGAKECNNLNSNSTTLNKLNEFNEKIGHAGVDVRKLMGRGSIGNSQSYEMVKWSQTAKKGSTFQIDEATSELLEEAYGFEVNCNYAIMTDDNGSFTCYQINEADGEAFNNEIKKEIERSKKIANQSISETLLTGENCTGICLWNQLTGLIGGGAIEILKQTGALTAFSCTKDKCNKNGTAYEPLGAAVEGLAQRAEKCQDDMEKVAQQRDDMIAKRKEAHQLLDILSGNLDVMCTCEMHEVNGVQEATGNIQECVAYDPEFIEDNMGGSCPTISEYQTKMIGQDNQNCVICRLFHTVLKAVQTLAQRAYDALAPALISLLGIALGIYIAYLTLITIASPATSKISEYLTKLTAQGAKVAIAIALLSAPSFVYTTLISPIIDGGVDFGITLAGEKKAAIMDMGRKFEFDASNTYLQAEVLQNAVGAAAAFNETAVEVPAIGRSMMCNAWYNDESLKDLVSGSYHFFPRIQMWLEGAILYIFGLMIAFAVGFYMVDCALQLGVVCAMMPFFVASWPFKITKSYTKQGWDIFLNTFFNFVVMGVVISAISQIMTQALSTGLSKQTLGALLDSKKVDELMEVIDFGGLQMAMLVICCMLALKLSGEIQNITNKLSGGLGISVGAGLGGTLSQFVKKNALAAAGAAGVAAAAKGGQMLEASGVSGAVRSMTGGAKNTATAAAGEAGMGSQAQQSSSSSRDHGQQTQFGAGAENSDDIENNESADETNEESEDNNSE